MVHHLQTARRGEDAAAAFLEENGYRLEARNVRTGRGEIDIVAWSPEGTLVFVEVKTRSGDGFGGPEGAVASRKMDSIARAAGAYMSRIKYEWAIRFDVIAVVLQDDRIRHLRHIPDAFFPMGRL
jgi:putative endonuclease